MRSASAEIVESSILGVFMTTDNASASSQASPLAEFMEEARHQRMPLTKLFQVAENLNAIGQKPVAAELYKAWIAFNG